jgi:pyridoxine kinase
MFGVLEATLASGERELQLVAAQDVIIDPVPRFEVVRLS